MDELYKFDCPTMMFDLGTKTIQLLVPGYADTSTLTTGKCSTGQDYLREGGGERGEKCIRVARHATGSLV